MDCLKLYTSNDFIPAIRNIGNLLVNGVTIEDQKSYEWGAITWKLVCYDKLYTQEVVKKAFEHLLRDNMVCYLNILRETYISLDKPTKMGRIISAIEALSIFCIEDNRKLNLGSGDITWILADYFNLYSYEEIRHAYQIIHNSTFATRPHYPISNIVSAGEQPFLFVQEIKKFTQNILCQPYRGGSFEDNKRIELIRLGGKIRFLELDNQTVLESITIKASSVKESELKLSPFSPKIRALSSHYTVVIGHGNAGCYEQFATLAHFYLQRGFNVTMFNHRGTRHSVGHSSEENYYKDVEGVYQSVKKIDNVTDNHIIWHGVSLGGACAVEVGVRHPDINLVLDQTFDNVRSMVIKILSPHFSGHTLLELASSSIQNLLQKELTMFNSEAKLNSLKGNILAVRSLDDVIIPSNSVENLLKQAQNVKYITSISVPGGHCCPWYVQNKNSARSLENYLVTSGLASYDL